MELVRAVIRTAVDMAWVALDILTERFMPSQQDIVRRQAAEARQRVDGIMRRARRDMDAASGMNKRRPFGDWRDFL